jgi:hypothetical protein
MEYIELKGKKGLGMKWAPKKTQYSKIKFFESSKMDPKNLDKIFAKIKLLQF